MDMKKFLQAVDGASTTKPVEGSNDMKKFLRVVSEAPVAPQQQPPEQIAYNQLRAQLDSLNSLRDPANNTYADVSPETIAAEKNMRQKLAQMAAALKLKGIDAEAEYDAPDPAVPAIAPVDLAKKYAKEDTVSEEVGMSRLLSIINEGKGPLNRLSQAESITMNTYNEYKPASKPVKSSLIDKYFKEVETEFAESQEKKNEKAKQLAERASRKIGNYGHQSTVKKHISQAQHPPENIIQMAKSGAKTDSHTRRTQEESNPTDSVNVDVPLMIRLMEYAREDAKDDAVLHSIAERLVELSKKVDVIGMDHYDAIITGNVDESLRTDNPCWKGYKPVGTKKKNGKTVPNCVPK